MHIALQLSCDNISMVLIWVVHVESAAKLPPALPSSIRVSRRGHHVYTDTLREDSVSFCSQWERIQDSKTGGSGIRGRTLASALRVTKRLPQCISMTVFVAYTHNFLANTRLIFKNPFEQYITNLSIYSCSISLTFR